MISSEFSKMKRGSVKKRSGNQKKQSFERTIPQHEVSTPLEEEEEAIFRKGSTDATDAMDAMDAMDAAKKHDAKQQVEEGVQSEDWLFTLSPGPIRIPVPKWRCLRGEELGEHVVGRLLDKTIRSFDRAVCERNFEAEDCRFASHCFHEAFSQLHLWANPSHEWASSSEWDRDVEPQTSSKDCWLSMRSLGTDIFQPVPPSNIEFRGIEQIRENSWLPREKSGGKKTATSNETEGGSMTSETGKTGKTVKSGNEQHVPELPEESPSPKISIGKSEIPVNLIKLGKEWSALSRHSRKKIQVGLRRSVEQLQPGLKTSTRTCKQRPLDRPLPEIWTERLEIQYAILPVVGEAHVKSESSD